MHTSTIRVLFCFSICLIQTLVATDVTFSLMSWNILGPLAPDVDLHFPPVRADQRLSDSKQRIDRIVQEINSSSVDIVCLQEASSQTCRWLYESGLDAKYVVGEMCRKGSFGGTVILFNKHRFDSVKKVACNLSSGGAAACVLLSVKQSNAHVAVCSLHLSRANDRADLQKGLQQLHECLHCMKHSFAGFFSDLTPIVLAGDFNTYYEEVVNYVGGQKLLTGSWNMFKHDSFTASSPHSMMYCVAQEISRERGFPFVTRCDSSFVAIDHILYQNMQLVGPNRVGRGDYVDAEVAQLSAPKPVEGKLLVQELYPSDHLPVFVTMQLIVPQAAAREPQESMYRRFMNSMELWLSRTVPFPTYV